jgi:hypothetical protein
MTLDSRANVTQRRRFVSPAVPIGITALVVTVLLSMLAFAAGGGLFTGRDDRGSFGIGCAWSHTLADDPILHPNDVAGSHLHAFFGNTSTSAWSTRRSLLRASTTCTEPADTAAVWAPVPALNGAWRTPTRERTYYFGPSSDAAVENLPPDLRMVAGNAEATSPAENPGVTWSCGRGTPDVDHPYTCGPYRGETNGDGVVARVDFPSCWDGVHLVPNAVSAHVVYPSGRSCPSDHPHRIPAVSVRVHTGVWDPCAGLRPCGPDDATDDRIALTLSSGPYYTMHADFWNTWRQRTLDTLVEACVRGHENCGVLSQDRTAEMVTGSESAD